ncbi:helix-turn-helix transcriptional regulator [Acidimangrovimonas sediminis]|uniref:helix-turn-helix transcriptional regulator n=1 Tax=Acidimangrovimonas sediminis TaxID=2056283 RepID=UPI000C802032|nr:helix-turn-helix domain-containing protein [Acidimangrovimonas sediminis]
MELAQEIHALREEVKALAERLENATAPKLMNTAQCAAFLGKSPDRLYEWRRERQGPPYLHMSSRSILYDRDDVIAWAKSHEVR